MKIALQFSGTYRNLNEILKFYTDLFKECDLDIFICLSNVFDYSTTKYDYKSNWRHPYVSPLHNNVAILNPTKMEAYLKTLYNFANIMIIDTNNDNSNRTALNDEKSILVCSYTHKRKKILCNETRKEYERKNGVKYDIVIDARTDWIICNNDNLNIFGDGGLGYMTKKQWKQFGGVDEKFFLRNPLNKYTTDGLFELINNVNDTEDRVYAFDNKMDGIWNGFIFGNSKSMDIYFELDFSDLYKSSILTDCIHREDKRYLLKKNIEIVDLYKLNFNYIYWRCELYDYIKKLM